MSRLRRTRWLFLTSASVAALTALSTGSASAQANWIGATSNNWTVGTNWTTGAPPNPGQTVNIGILGAPPLSEAVLGVGGPVNVSVGTTFIGNSGGPAGNLTIQNGSTLTSTGQARLGVSAGSTGIVTVTGPGSQWNIPGGSFFVGFLGVGTLNIRNSAKVVTGAGTVLGGNAPSSGTLNISGGGGLETQSLRGGAGARQVNFDNGILRAGAGAPSTFIFGFSGTQLNLLAGGLTIDTNGLSVGTDVTSGFTGTGGLTVTGGGVFSLLANSSYSGATSIQSGSSLSLQGAGSIANSSRIIADGTFDIAGVTAPGTNIQSLAGGGAVTLGTKDLTITNANDLFSGIISGTGGLTVTGGTQTLSGANNYIGATTVNGATLRAGATNTFSAASALNVLSGTLDLAGFNQTVASLGNAGTVNLGGAPGTTLTVASNYAGNGGGLVINTVLSGDPSATGRLVAATTSGTTTLRVNNVGGGGAQTIEGIKVVDVLNPGASTGTFTLQGDYVFHGAQALVAGAYAYVLQQNGVATPTDGDWYLRSALINPPPELPAGPLYQPGVPLYENYGQVLLGHVRLPTMQQRVGNRYWGDEESMVVNRTAAAYSFASVGAPTSARDGLPDSPSLLWGRVEGGHGRFNPTTTAGSRYDADHVVMQSGLDGLLLENGSGRLIAGVNGQYGNVSSAVRSVYGDGKIVVDGYSLGGALTWYGHEGFYVDGQAQVTWFSSKLTSDILTGAMANDNDALARAFSVEGGKRFALGGGWSVTPQAQLSYASVSADLDGRFGTHVTLDEAKSLLGRLGLSADYRNVWRDRSGQVVRSSVHGITNLYYEFFDGTLTNVAGTTFANANERLWGGIGLGGTYNWANDRYVLYGEVSANTSLKDFGNSYSVNGTAGFRLRW